MPDMTREPNGALSDEFLNVNWFCSLDDAKQIIEALAEGLQRNETAFFLRNLSGRFQYMTVCYSCMVGISLRQIKEAPCYPL